MAATIDTLKLAKRFRDAKNEEERAEAFAEGLRDVHEAGRGELATKGDVTHLAAELRSEIREVEARLTTKIVESQNTLLKWLIPMLSAQLLAILALVARAYLPG